AADGHASVRLRRDRDEVILREDVADIQLDSPVEPVRELALVTDPEVEGVVDRALVGPGDIVHFLTRVGVGGDIEADDAPVLPTVAAADVDVLQETLIERVVRDQVEAPGAEFRNVGVFQEAVELVGGVELLQPDATDGLLTPFRTPELDLAGGAAEELGAFVDPGRERLRHVRAACARLGGVDEDVPVWCRTGDQLVLDALGFRIARDGEGGRLVGTAVRAPTAGPVLIELD